MREEEHKGKTRESL